MATFERLARVAAPALTVTHPVDEALLADARRLGADDSAPVASVHAAMHGPTAALLQASAAAPGLRRPVMPLTR